jgi:hypothetical protein
MKRLSGTCAALLVVIAFLLAGCASHSAQDAGWITLVDGTADSLKNWNRIGDANWRAEGDVIVADRGKGGFLVSRSSYKDFQIRAEFWADHSTNSGIFIRLTDPQKVTASNSYEVNVFDQRPEPSYGTGAIVDFAKVNPMPKAGGRWNTFLITAQGSRLVVELNGVQTVAINDSKFSAGPVALQYGSGPKDALGGAIKWRKVQIKPL